MRILPETIELFLIADCHTIQYDRFSLRILFKRIIINSYSGHQGAENLQ